MLILLPALIHVGDPIAQTSAYGGSGEFDQSAGSVSVVGNLKLGTDGDGGVTPARGNGTYNLSGGALTVNNVGYFGNSGGTGTFTQTGGSAQFGTATNSGGLQLGTNRPSRRKAAAPLRSPARARR